MMVNEDIIDCFTTKEAKDEVKTLSEIITSEEKSTIQKLVSDKDAETFSNKEGKKVKINEYVTGLKIKYSAKRR